MNRLDEQYRGMLAEVLYNGTSKEDRTGTGTLSKFGMQIKHRMEDGFPLLTTKKVAFKTMATELKWFLRGDTKIKFLQDRGCNIWNGDYEKSGFTNGDLGPIYGAQWRNWNGFGGGIDQIANLIKDLKENPDSRRHLVSAWNVSDLKYMALPPCHYSFQCYVADGKLSLLWNQRSADLFLGVPFNIASYGTLLSLLCIETGYKPGELIGNFGDVHLYKNHLDQAAEQISREPYNPPKFDFYEVDILGGDFNYSIIDYSCHPAIKAPLSN